MSDTEIIATLRLERQIDARVVNELALLDELSQELAFDADLDLSVTQGGAAFLGVPDLTDTTALFFYFGWESVNGGWLVQRQTRLTADSVSANEGNNPAFTNLTEAWPNRVSLNYS